MPTEVGREIAERAAKLGAVAIGYTAQSTTSADTDELSVEVLVEGTLVRIHATVEPRRIDARPLHAHRPGCAVGLRVGALVDALAESAHQASKAVGITAAVDLIHDEAHAKAFVVLNASRPERAVTRFEALRAATCIAAHQRRGAVARQRALVSRRSLAVVLRASEDEASEGERE